MRFRGQLYLSMVKLYDPLNDGEPDTKPIRSPFRPVSTSEHIEHTASVTRGDSRAVISNRYLSELTDTTLDDTIK